VRHHPLEEIAQTRLMLPSFIFTVKLLHNIINLGPPPSELFRGLIVELQGDGEQILNTYRSFNSV
jgi:hypothetical protein